MGNDKDFGWASIFLHQRLSQVDQCSFMKRCLLFFRAHRHYPLMYEDQVSLLKFFNFTLITITLMKQYTTRMPQQNSNWHWRKLTRASRDMRQHTSQGIGDVQVSEWNSSFLEQQRSSIIPDNHRILKTSSPALLSRQLQSAVYKFPQVHGSPPPLPAIHLFTIYGEYHGEYQSLSWHWKYIVILMMMTQLPKKELKLCAFKNCEWIIRPADPWPLAITSHYPNLQLRSPHEIDFKVIDIDFIDKYLYILWQSQNLKIFGEIDMSPPWQNDSFPFQRKNTFITWVNVGQEIYTWQQNHVTLKTQSPNLYGHWQTFPNKAKGYFGQQEIPTREYNWNLIQYPNSKN